MTSPSQAGDEKGGGLEVTILRGGGVYLYLEINTNLWREPSKLWREEEMPKGFCFSTHDLQNSDHRSAYGQTIEELVYRPKFLASKGVFGYFFTPSVGCTLGTIDAQCHRKTCLPLHQTRLCAYVNRDYTTQTRSAVSGCPSSQTKKKEVGPQSRRS